MLKGETESYEYDKNYNVTKIIDTWGNATQLKYDRLKPLKESKIYGSMGKRFI